MLIVGVALATIALAVLFGLRQGAPVRLLSVALLIAGLGLATASGFTKIDTGHTGVTSLFGDVDPQPLPQGLHLIFPLKSVTQMSVRTETLTMREGEEEHPQSGVSIEAISADGMAMHLDATVNFRLVPADAPWVLQNLGANYVEKIIAPALRTAVREALSEFSAQDSYGARRADLTRRIEETLRRHVRALLDEYKFKGEAVIVQQVLLRRMTIPKQVLDAIEKKLAAEQNAQAMQYILQKETQEAERKRIEARGIADFQKIVTEGISDKLLSWKGIEATLDVAKSPNAKIVIIGNSKNGGLPLIFNASEVAPAAQ